ncbi:MAG: lysophospholipid acyltransferase family protein [Rhodoferax sp.]|nr:lysophospholipid acyltransferase family protein [Rhodoferax sp.]
MKRLRVRAHASWKFTRAMVHIVTGFATVIFVFPRLTSLQKEERIQLWAHSLLARLAIKLVVNGQPPAQGPVLLAANHISWLDIVVMHAARHCRFVSKADVKRWPLIGTLATGAGTLFIERESRRDAMRVVHDMAERLHAGDILAVFPEGTTSDGVSLLPFHANLFQAAIKANAPVLPVALQFADITTGACSLAPCYINDDSLMGSIWRTLTAPPLCAVLTYGDPQSAQGRDRRAWAADLRLAVEGLRARPVEA